MLILLLFIVSCQKSVEEDLQKDSKTLSEFQIEACNVADEAGTCSTRLEEISVVSKADCCEILGKCC